MTPADILTEVEAAELMRVKPTTVRALGRRGCIRRIPPTRPPRYDRGSVESYLARDLDTTRRYVGKTPGAMTEAAKRLDEAMGGTG